VAAAPTTAPGVCAPITAGSTLQVQNVTGLRTVGSPKWQANLTARYQTTVSDKLKAFGQVNYTYIDDQQYEVGNPKQTIQKAYSVVNLTAGIGTVDDRLMFSVYARNLFDENYVGRISFSNPGLMQTIPYGSLQTFGASVDFRF
jgi:iron complex outermembrane receptor protein